MKVDVITLNEKETNYHSEPLIYHEESYKIIGICMDVHNELGKGYQEKVYNHVLSLEFQERGIPFEREKRFQVKYKNHLLPFNYYCDFIIDQKFVLEVKAQESFSSGNFKQVLSYLAVSKLKLGLLINFGDDSLQVRRVVL